MLLGTLVNGLAVLAGGTIGLFLNKGLSERIATAIMNALALCVLAIGIDGMLAGENIMITILSMVLGTLIGEGIDLNAKVHRFGHALERKVAKPGNQVSVAEGFVTGSLLFCVGAMAIVGPLQSGLTGDHGTLFAKSLIDGISAIILASTLGVGVLLSAGLIVVYESTIAVFANILAPLLTDAVINEITAVGSLLIIGLAFNMMKVTDLKIMNYAPAVFLPIVLGLFM